jgi:RND family efflux transporter MFP subunit
MSTAIEETPQDGSTQNVADQLPAPGPDARRIRATIVGAVALLLAGVIGLYWRASAKTNHVALTDAAKPVSVQRAQAGSFRPVRTYVGTIDAWNSAKIGPQYVSAYVSTVLFRPGASVKRGEVLATLDCRNASAASREIAAKAKSLEQRQVAVEHEAERVQEMAQGNFASKNEAEQLAAKASAEKADIESMRASMISRSLEVDDCILRAPFAGEVADRFVDPGAYVRPGNPVVTVIDRAMVRIVGDAPESDFAVVAPGTEVMIEVQATGQKKVAKISRRAPSADDNTRTVHFEIDVPNADRALPAGTTAKLTIHFGEARPATTVALRSATLRGDKATLFVVSDNLAKRVELPVVGELGGTLFVDPRLAAGSPVVVEGRALLDDGDRVLAKELAQ